MSDKQDQSEALKRATERVDALEKDLATANERREAALAELKTTQDKLDAVEQDRDALKRSLAAQKGATTKAKNEVEELEAAAKPRPFGRLDGETLAPAELLDLIEAAALVEIAFSDGKAVVRDMPPLKVSGERAWSITGRGLALDREQVLVHGPAAGKPPFVIAGYALVADGEQIAFVQRTEQLTIDSGRTFNIADDIAF